MRHFSKHKGRDLRHFFMGRHRGGGGFRHFGRGGPDDFMGRGGFGGRKIGAPDLQLLILALLESAPSHGYELIKLIEERSDGFYTPSPGVIYPALTYLEETSLINAVAEGTKKRYELTAEGREHLAGRRAEAEALLAQLEQLGSRVRRMREAMGRMDDPSGQDPATEEAPIERGSSPLQDERVNAVLRRLHAQGRPGGRGGPGGSRGRGGRGGGRGGRFGRDMDPSQFAEVGFSIDPQQGELMYLLCRSLKATRVVDFATSLGVSALYLAAALRDNGGGTVIGSEIVPAKIEAAKANLAEAGLSQYLELRAGDARQTLRDLGGPIDFALIDGWPSSQGPSLSREVIELVAPQLRRGGMVLNDNAEPDYLEYIRDPANGFISLTLPIKGSTELSLKL